MVFDRAKRRRNQRRQLLVVIDNSGGDGLRRQFLVAHSFLIRQVMQRKGERAFAITDQGGVLDLLSPKKGARMETGHCRRL